MIFDQIMGITLFRTYLQNLSYFHQNFSDSLQIDAINIKLAQICTLSEKKIVL